MAYNLIYLTEMDNEMIHELIESSIVPENKDIVLEMLKLANRRFNQHHLDYNVIRGASYLRAASIVAKQTKDLTFVTELELKEIKWIGKETAAAIRGYIDSR